MSDTRKTNILSCLVIAAFVIGLYSVSLGHNFLFDEENVILRNPLVKSWTMIPAVFTHGFFYLGGAQAPFMEYYRPLTTLTFLADYQFWHADPMGYNATSTFFHLALCLVFFGVLLKLLGDGRAAFIAALLYAVHPLHTEAVGHVSCRGETLGALFLALTLLFYLRSKKVPALLFHLLGLLCKESAALIPVYLLAVEWSHFKSDWRSALKKVLPFIILSAAYVFFRKFICPVRAELALDPVRDILLRVFSMGPALLHYARALLAPKSFELFGWVPAAKTFSDPKIAVSAGVFLLLIGALVYSVKKRGEALPALLFLTAGFIPFMQVIHFYPEWAEHFLTIPAMGFALTAGLAVKRKKELALVCAVFVLFLGYRTWQRNTLYNDPENYYLTLSHSESPYKVNGYQELGKLQLAQGKTGPAKAYFEEALKTGTNGDISHFLLGYCSLLDKDTEGALVHFSQAEEMGSGNAQYPFQTGDVLMKLGRYDEASAKFEKVLTENPDSFAAYRLLIRSEELAGRPSQALEWAQKGLKRAEGKDFESAMLTASIFNLAMRQGWRQMAHEKMRELSERYSSVPWYGEVGRYLAGKMNEKSFMELARTKYRGFDEEAKAYVERRKQLALQ